MSEKQAKLIYVLVVEDSALSATVAKMMLEAKGCKVDIADNGESALKQLPNHYDLVLLDIGLPDMDGMDIARFIRTQAGPMASVPIVALTAHATDIENTQLAKQLGLNGLLSKPLTPALCEVLLTRFVYSLGEKEDFIQN